MHITKKFLSPQFLPYFKISNTRLLALHWSKKLTDPANHITLTVYSLLPECTNYHFSRKIHHFWRSRTKNRIHQNTPFQVQRKKCQEGPIPSPDFPRCGGVPPFAQPTFLLPSLLDPPLRSPRIPPSQIYAAGAKPRVTSSWQRSIAKALDKSTRHTCHHFE